MVLMGGAPICYSKCGTENPSTNNLCAKRGNALAKHSAKNAKRGPADSVDFWYFKSD